MVGVCACSSTCPWITRSRRRPGCRSRVVSASFINGHLCLGWWPFSCGVDAWFGGRSCGIPGIPSVVAPWRLSHYHWFAYTTPGVEAHGSHAPRIQAEDREPTPVRRWFRVARDPFCDDRQCRVRDVPRRPARRPGQDGRDGGTAPTSRTAEGGRPAAGPAC